MNKYIYSVKNCSCKLIPENNIRFCPLNMGCAM